MNLLNWLPIPVFLFLVYLLWRSVKGSRQDLVFWSALGFKLGCGLAFGWLYRNYLGLGDTWYHHEITIQVTDLAKADATAYLRFLFLDDVGVLQLPWKPFYNSFFFLKPTSLLYLLSGNSYWWASFFLSLFSFWGCWFLVQRLRRYFPDYGFAATVAFLFFPSVVFWTSGFSKDSLFMGSMCFTIGLVLQLARREGGNSWQQFLLLIVCIWLFWRVKFFLAAVLLVLLSTYVVVQELARRIHWLHAKASQVVTYFLLLSLGAFLASFLHPTFTLNFFLKHLLYNYNNLLAISDPAKPILHLAYLEPTLWSVLVNAPQALWQMLFRPFVWEPAPLFYKLAAVENLGLLVLVLAAVIHQAVTRRLPKLPSFVAVLLLFFVLAGVLVALPTPNLGSLFRYRAPLLPFFLLVIIAWGPLPGWWQKWTGSTAKDKG
ncbi:hypothetical protein [Rufibacter sp. LB8]|uniref:hypothetical protein n=1 Tax=Rufibacter sp. LB8 TaxID=2777781 RepID=UPI00178C3DB8|nr:hypothetical protein [Rufibacter sp. LB8]